MNEPPYYVDEQVTLHHGDSLQVLTADELGYDYRLGYHPPAITDASIDAVVTDPPYDLTANKKGGTGPASVNLDSPAGRARIGTGGFMGKEWDATGIAFKVDLWEECLRVLKPGGHLLAFGGTRTWHRMAVAIDDAGFELRDSIAWMYGSGFPKSLDVSKAIDKSVGAAREVIGQQRTNIGMQGGNYTNGSLRANVDVTAAATPEARQWEGWGTALKPAFEPIVVARKPLDGTVAGNVLAYGTGALNIDACRIGTDATTRVKRGGSNDFPHEDDGWTPVAVTVGSDAGRWPANVVLDEDQAAELDQQAPRAGAGGRASGPTLTGGSESVARGRFNGLDRAAAYPGDGQGGASRFFYTAKAPGAERVRLDGIAHPTVKPLSLMRWLVRLVTPPGGTVLEPFAGSGTTVEACLLEGFRCVAIEREAEYLPLIRQRINRRVDPVEAVRASGEDAGLFDLLGGEST